MESAPRSCTGVLGHCVRRDVWHSWPQEVAARQRQEAALRRLHVQTQARDGGKSDFLALRDSLTFFDTRNTRLLGARGDGGGVGRGVLGRTGGRSAVSLRQRHGGWWWWKARTTYGAMAWSARLLRMGSDMMQVGIC